MKRSLTLRLADARQYLGLLEKRKNECLGCVEHDPSQLQHACMDVDLLSQIEETKQEIADLLHSETTCQGCVDEQLNQEAHDPTCVTITPVSGEGSHVAEEPHVAEEVAKEPQVTVDLTVEESEFAVEEAHVAEESHVAEEAHVAVNLALEEGVDEGASVAEDLAREFKESASPVYELN
jgi:hypothetical protein